jgi:AcrR family transcriptional regulator
MTTTSTTRTYRLARRAQGIADTRQRIVQAARGLLLGDGPQALSIEAIAGTAGVARTTVFQQFGSKAAILRELELDTSARSGLGRLFAAADADGADGAEEVDALRGLRTMIEAVCRAWAAEREVFRSLRALAALDPAPRAALDAGGRDEERRRYLEALASRLQRQQRLRPGVTRRCAAELLFLLTSFETFDTLYAARGEVREVVRLLTGQVAAFVDLAPLAGGIVKRPARSARSQRG